jgi:hypothetical protein
MSPTIKPDPSVRQGAPIKDHPKAQERLEAKDRAVAAIVAKRAAEFAKPTPCRVVFPWDGTTCKGNVDEDGRRCTGGHGPQGAGGYHAIGKGEAEKVREFNARAAIARAMGYARMTFYPADDRMMTEPANSKEGFKFREAYERLRWTWMNEQIDAEIASRQRYYDAVAAEEAAHNTPEELLADEADVWYAARASELVAKGDVDGVSDFFDMVRRRARLVHAGASEKQVAAVEEEMTVLGLLPPGCENGLGVHHAPVRVIDPADFV